MRYEINEKTFAIKIYKDESSKVPFLHQPTYPNQKKWESYEAAEKWAISYIKSLTDKDAPFAPIGPGMEGLPKPTEEQKRKIDVKRKVLQGIPISMEEAVLLVEKEI